MIEELQTFQTQDLVLKVSPNYDTIIFDPNKYEPFLDALCADREFQKEAIREVVRYFLGRQYANLRALAEENYGDQSHQKLREKYATLQDFAATLQLPNQLSCSVDHATGTGKSFVLYGIARILLAEGAIDQVLLLCPSNTIEISDTEKFRRLSRDKTLKELLPPDSVIVNPRIINASNTIRTGDICLENIHATYEKTRSSIRDSLAGKGARTLVLNDEAHHLMNPSDKGLKKWKEFLLDPAYGFKYVVNASGTCYIDNEYFSDVIHRYSLPQAIKDGVLKKIHYVAEDSPGGENEKFQKFYANHLENKKKYRRLKPLTILVTKDIAACERLTEKLIDFIAKQDKSTKKLAEAKVLIVTSADKHKKNIPLLRRVDEKANSVEWITSVSMLTEGWDVQNVFQIVPHEERAFNSKLLIAQVLGRGLRIPAAYNGGNAVVTVFNHDKWASNIQGLVDDILENEVRIHSYRIAEKNQFDFDLYNINYKRVEEEVDYPQEDPVELFKGKASIRYSSQAEELSRATTYRDAISGREEQKSTLVQYDLHPVDYVVNDVFNRLVLFDQDAGTTYSVDFPKNRIEQLVKNSLAEIHDNSGKVSETNRNKTLSAFGTIGRAGTKSLRIEIQAQDLLKINTRDIKASSAGISSLRRDSSIVYDDIALTASKPEDRRLLRDLEQDESLPRKAMIEVQNRYNFKTCLNIVLTSFKPEREFVKALVSEQNAKVIDAWIKSLNVGFYSIAYSWRKGEHPKQASFNPDFFVKIGKNMIVVEIKTDEDISEENVAKLKYAKAHFARVNSLQKEQVYYFKFLSADSYDLFFKSLRDGTYPTFRSVLEADLES